MRTASNPEYDSLKYGSMVVVMGVTGAGKSTFINTLAGTNAVQVGHDLAACTAKCEAVPAKIGGSNVLLIDTPGFDDPSRTDAEILAEISKLLAAQYELGVSLKGCILLHRITDDRYQGSSVKTLKIFEQICGEKAMGNVLLVTTRWNQVEEERGAKRERELRETWWSYMVGKGAIMTRFHGDKASGMGIISQLLGKADVVLDIQKELVDQGKRLSETSAGNLVNDNIEELKHEYEKQLRELDDLRRTLRENDRKMKQQVERDLANERAKLQQALQDEKTMRKNIAEEVRKEIKQELHKNKSSGIVSSVIGILGMFVGLDYGTGNAIADWFLNTPIADAVGGIFSF